MRRLIFGGVVSVLAILLLAPGPVLAQDVAGIAGSVQDETGGYLPGVAVEVRSPAMIEQVRTANSDNAGLYRITNLPSGTYSVTFQLQGFGTVVREGIVVQGGFVADVDAELSVGSVNESVTVTSAAPLVDIKNTQQQSVLPAERINVLPGAAGIFSASRYVPGTTPGGVQNNLPVLHGSEATDGQPYMDGVKTGMQLQGKMEFNAGFGTITTEAMVNEVVLDTGSQSAEYAQSGVRTNVVPKAGGNNFNFDIFASGTMDSLQSDNQSQELKDQGFEFAPTDYRWTLNPAVGGPILKDKLWFFASILKTKNRFFILDSFYDLDEPSTPDGVTADDLRMVRNDDYNQRVARLTLQLTQRNKLTFSFMHHQAAGGPLIQGTSFGRVNPEAGFFWDTSPAYINSVRWTAPVTNRLLLEVQGAIQRADVHTNPWDHGGELRMALEDQATGANYQSSFQNHHNADHHRRLNASVAYVTGSHNFKAGLNYVNNYTSLSYTPPGEIFQGYTFNGFPLGVLVGVNGTSRSRIDMNCDCGLYVQDAWTRDRLTLNGGFRYDWFNNSVPGGSRPAGFWTEAVTLPDPIIEDTPNWKNFSGRFGGAYDVFGDGSTAVKVAAGRYVENMGTGITSAFNPINAYALDWRNWNDLNGDLTAVNPDGTPQFDEVGPSFNPNFGLGTITTELDPLAGRSTNWEYSAGIERQLGAGWAISGMWHRRSYGNYRWTQNLNTSAADWGQAGTWVGPTDSRLPDSAQGVQVPIYVTDPDFEIITGNNYLTSANDNWRTWNGFEVILDGELPRGGFMTGSFTVGNPVDHFCHAAEVQTPNDLRHCETSSGYRPMGKLSGALPLPWDTMISGLFQVFAGAPIAATYAIDATDFPGLNLGSGSGISTLEVNLIEPGTEYEDYTTSMQLRFSKVFTLGATRTRVYMDASNIFNKARVTARNRFYGGGGVQNPDFDRIIAIEPGRRLSFGMQMNF